MKKTKEELEVLKNEVQDINSKLAELSEDELKLVAGGSGGEESIRFSTFLLTGHIPADEAQKNMYVYVSIDGEDKWYSGTIYDIIEESYWLILSRRRYRVYLTGYNGYGASGDMDFYSNEVTLYRNMEWKWN